jgi:hypothetical protein
MKPFYILAASMAETLYGLLIASLAFHRGDKSNDIATVGVKYWDCTKTSFSLSLENFRSLPRRYMPDSSDTRVYLAIDAVSHKAHVLFDPHTGRIAGLTEPLVLDPHTIDVLENDPNAFGRFLRDCVYHVAKFSFVSYLTPFDPREKVFPMAILPFVQGQATDAIISPFLERDKF